MNPTVRKLLFDPLTSGDLSLVVPDLSIGASGDTITAPARLRSHDGDRFIFELHFPSPEIPEALRRKCSGVMGPTDRLRITGQIEGEIYFSALVFPAVRWISRSRGTSMATLKADRLELLPEHDDLRSADEMHDPRSMEMHAAALGAQQLSAHLIFHGPKLHILDTGTHVTTVHDFLGETTCSTFDTHVFKANGWEGALIQKGPELHLHLRKQKEATAPVPDFIDLVNRVSEAAAFTHGFHPWPTYREIRLNHRVVERWLHATLNLEQSYLAPVSERMGVLASAGTQPDLVNIIPTIAEGLALLTTEQRNRLKTLLWNVRSSDLGDLPCSTKLLILCSAFDGLMKIISGDKGHTSDEWKTAAKSLHINWEGWLEPIMKIRKRHRDDLGHGRLWILEDSPAESFFDDYPRLGCAFMAVIAVLCGYEGPISSDPFGSKNAPISDLKL